MHKRTVKKAIRFLEQRLKESGLNVSQIILFGSHSFGNATADSDIDLVVISEDFRRKNIFKRVEMTKDSERQTIREFHVPLDIILMTPEELASEASPIAATAREGEVVFAA